MTGSDLFRLCKKSVSVFLALTMVLSPTSGYAQSALVSALPEPGKMLNVSAAFTPVVLKGMVIHPEDPLKFDFLMDTGTNKTSGEDLRKEAEKSIKYFLASLTVPEEDLWVNLSPYEKNRIVPDAFGRTAMGRDLLAEDYVLKQLTSSLLYPENGLGKEFWSRIYAAASRSTGTTDIDMNSFNRVWIVPSEAKVWEHDGKVVILKSRLKVMLETDYFTEQKEGSRLPSDSGLSVKATQGNNPTPNGPAQDLAKNILRDVVVPAIEKEVNEGANFARLRQIYAAMVLSAWYKIRLREGLLGKAYADKNKVAGVEFADGANKDEIYNRYLEAARKGVFNYIREEKDQATGETVPRKYFSGGFECAMLSKVVLAGFLFGAAATLPPAARAEANDVSAKNTMIVKSGLTDVGVNANPGYLAQANTQGVKAGGKAKSVDQNDITRLLKLLKRPEFQGENDSERHEEEEDEDPKTPVVDALVKIGTPAVPRLLEALKDRDADVRMYSAKALGKIGDEIAIPGLLGMLNDQDYYVPIYAIDALVSIGQPAVPGLLEALKDKDDNVRWRVADALESLGHPVAPRLLERLKDADATGVKLPEKQLASGGAGQSEKTSGSSAWTMDRGSMLSLIMRQAINDQDLAKGREGLDPRFKRGAVTFNKEKIVEGKKLVGGRVGEIRGSEDGRVLERIWAAVNDFPIRYSAFLMRYKLIENYGPYNYFKLDFDVDGTGKQEVLVNVTSPFDKEIVMPKILDHGTGRNKCFIVSNHKIDYIVTDDTVTRVEHQTVRKSEFHRTFGQGAGESIYHALVTDSDFTKFLEEVRSGVIHVKGVVTDELREQIVKKFGQEKGKDILEILTEKALVGSNIETSSQIYRNAFHSIDLFVASFEAGAQEGMLKGSSLLQQTQTVFVNFLDPDKNSPENTDPYSVIFERLVLDLTGSSPETKLMSYGLFSVPVKEVTHKTITYYFFDDKGRLIDSKVFQNDDGKLLGKPNYNESERIKELKPADPKSKTVPGTPRAMRGGGEVANAFSESEDFDGIGLADVGVNANPGYLAQANTQGIKSVHVPNNMEGASAPKEAAMTIPGPTYAKTLFGALVLGAAVSHALPARAETQNPLGNTGLVASGGVKTEEVSRNMSGVPSQPSVVYVKPGDRRLFVRARLSDGSLDIPRSFVAKGVSRTMPKGGDPETFKQDFYNWYVQDAEKMAGTGINSVRIDSFVLSDPRASQMLDEFNRRNIWVVPTLQLADFDTDTGAQAALVPVQQFKNHPAVLMWEISYRTYTDFSAEKMEAAAQKLKQADPSRPVSALESIYYSYMWRSEIMNLLTVAPSVDVWGLQPQNARAYSDEIAPWLNLSPKPCYVAMGSTASWVNDIKPGLSGERGSGYLIGGFYANWSGLPYIDEGPLVSPDRTQWTAEGTSFQSLYMSNAVPPLVANPVLTITSQGGSSGIASFALNGTDLVRRYGGGGGGRGVNLAVVNLYTGTQLNYAENFDTCAGWLSVSTRFDDLFARIDSLPDGSVFALSVGDEGGFRYPDNSRVSGIEAVYQKFEKLGSTRVRDVLFRGSWILVVSIDKGQPRVLSESVGLSDGITESVTISGQPDAGHDLRVTEPYITQGANAWDMVIGDVADFTGTYTVEYSSDLKTWTVAQSGILASKDGKTPWTDPLGQARSGNGYYRVVKEPAQAQDKHLGGIDLDAKKLDLQIQRDGNGVPLPVDQQDWSKINIQGFIPVIYSIEPVDMPMLLGLNVPGAAVGPYQAENRGADLPLGRELEPVGS